MVLLFLLEDCPVNGIRSLSETDIENAYELGYKIKLLSLIKKIKTNIEISVEPTLIPKNHLISSVSDSFNAIFIEGDIVGETMFYGRGAGMLPTASSVIGDIVDAAKGFLNNSGISESVKIMIQNKQINLTSFGRVKKDVIFVCCWMILLVQWLLL